ncbi:HD-GYP domain-containing protein [Roseococcus sp. SYP-B2431]|uniref:HD-GYP domain-containing protein n=1 Tax=Roseococcus sp. SYP-B2431 TaxID=2496640 RepID=UPI0013F4BB93|nr:HD domain-containing phosphohydrolase [Roseococcus sp. SYP-B2431]
MPIGFPGIAADALPAREAARPRGRPASGEALARGPGARLGLCLELRARELIRRLHDHDPASAAHSLRVSEITMAMWRVAPDLLGSPETALFGSLLHDVGKLHVPRAILTSRRILDPEERAAISSHAGMGAELLLAQGFPESIAAVARGHHERWSGGGYPTGLAARFQTPIVRAVAVADAFDAMTDPGRAYRAPLGRREALREVAACAGTHFEPRAAEMLAESLSGRGAGLRRHRPVRSARRKRARHAAELAAAL